MAVKRDNSHPDVKRLFRREALKRLENPSVLETHGGEGELRRSCYFGIPGAMCEKDETKAEKLARNFPDVPVYLGDSIKLLKSKDIGRTFNLIDLDAYGDPWPHFDHALRCPALEDRCIFVVTDGLIQGVRLGGSWTKGSLRHAVEVLGNDLFKRYRQAVEVMLADLCAKSGWTWELLAFRWYPNIVYYMVEVRRVGSAGASDPLTVHRSAKKADPFYTSAPWKAARAKALARAKARCSKCGSVEDLHVDHITPRNLGGSDFDQTNLRVLCRPCHSKVTREDQNAGVLPS